jgi:hypothetical protein
MPGIRLYVIEQGLRKARLTESKVYGEQGLRRARLTAGKACVALQVNRKALQGSASGNYQGSQW